MLGEVGLSFIPGGKAGTNVGKKALNAADETADAAATVTKKEVKRFGVFGQYLTILNNASKNLYEKAKNGSADYLSSMADRDAIEYQDFMTSSMPNYGSVSSTEKFGNLLDRIPDILDMAQLATSDGSLYGGLSDLGIDPNAVITLMSNRGHTGRGKGGGDGGASGSSGASVDRDTRPYNPNRTREDLEATYGPDNVTSTTVPPSAHHMRGEPNTAVNFDYDGKQISIPYDDRGFPVFDDVTKFETRVEGYADFSKKSQNGDNNYKMSMQDATRNLKREIESGRIDRGQFTEKQLEDIMAERERISGFIWHHHQEAGRMQLVPKPIHDKTSHLGGAAMIGGR